MDAKVDPKAHDEATAALYGEQDKAERQLASAIERAHRVAGDVRVDRWTRRERWGMSIQDVLAKIEAKIAALSPEDVIWGTEHPVNVLRSWDAATAELVRTGAEIARLDAIYDAQPWQRFFPCNNSDGHIHAELTCHTLNKGQFRTDMGWRPDLSGHTVAEAIADLGTWLCSMCFPDAPAEHCQTRSQATKAERETKAAEKAEAKFDKNLRDGEIILDGRIGHSGKGDTVTTVFGLKKVIREVSEMRHYSGINQHHTWYEPTLVAAEEAKRVLLAREERKPGTGATQAEIDLIIKRAEQRARKEANRR
jgi:hypothetical protein